MRLIYVAMCLLVTSGAGAETLVPAPSWQYQFPPGLVDWNMHLSDDSRYLAMGTMRWSCHPSGKPEEVTTEGENAVYLFDLREKQLLWKQTFPEGSAASVRGMSASGEFLAVQVGGGDRRVRVWRDRGGQSVEGAIDYGALEPGMRLYDREGHLIACNAPIETGRITRNRSALFVGPLSPGEMPLAEDLTLTLAAAGIRSTAVRRGAAGFGYLEREGQRLIAYRNLAGEAEWECTLPPSRSLGFGGWGMLERSPDGGYALVLVVPTDVAEPDETMRLLLFGRSEELLWTKDLNMRIAGRPAIPARSVTLALAAGATSAVVDRGPSPALVQVLDRQGREKSTVTFGSVVPTGVAVSPNGRYWAASLTRWAEGPGTDDKGWHEGIHVFDCATGAVMWRSSAMAGYPLRVVVTDTGGVIATSPTEQALAVFDSPTREEPVG